MTTTIGELFNASLNSPGRKAFRFSSTKRDRRDSLISRKSVAQAELYKASAIGDTAAIRRNATAIADYEQPIDEATRLQGNAGVAPVIMLVNPKNCSFDQGKRYTPQVTMEGTDYHHFTDPTGRRNNDVLTLSMEGSTGNIYNLTGSEAANVDAENRRRVWHQLYALSLEEMMIQEPLTGRLIRNEFYIEYTSLLLPFPVIFTGFFDAPLKFNESADKPHSRGYSFKFVVQKTAPEMHNLVKELYAVTGVPSTRRGVR